MRTIPFCVSVHDNIFFLHGQLSWLHVLATVKKAAVHTVVLRSCWSPDFSYFGYRSKSGRGITDHMVILVLVAWGAFMLSSVSVVHFQQQSTKALFCVHLHQPVTATKCEVIPCWNFNGISQVIGDVGFCCLWWCCHTHPFAMVLLVICLSSLACQNNFRCQLCPVTSR